MMPTRRTAPSLMSPPFLDSIAGPHCRREPSLASKENNGTQRAGRNHPRRERGASPQLARTREKMLQPLALAAYHRVRSSRNSKTDPLIVAVKTEPS
jgi:hypothetical protein